MKSRSRRLRSSRKTRRQRGGLHGALHREVLPRLVAASQPLRGGKVTKSKGEAPPNTFPKGSLERTVFGQIVSYFYFSSGSFPNDSEDPAHPEYVSLDRLLATSKFRKLQEMNPTVDMRAFVLAVIADAFDIHTTPDGTVLIRARSWSAPNIGALVKE